MHTISPSKGPFTSSLLSFPSFLCHGAKRKFVSFYKKNYKLIKLIESVPIQVSKAFWAMGIRRRLHLLHSRNFFHSRWGFYFCTSVCLSLSLCLSVFLVDLCLSRVYLFIRRESSKYVEILQMFERIADLLTYFSGVTVNVEGLPGESSLCWVIFNYKFSPWLFPKRVHSECMKRFPKQISFIK